MVRPDTTWEKDNADFFPPEFVEQLTFSPVVFARILKPGRSVVRRFASRYYDAVNFGVLLYPENLLDASSESFATASCLDHTSFLPTPMYNPVTLGEEGNSFILKHNGKTIFEYGPHRHRTGRTQAALRQGRGKDTCHRIVVRQPDPGFQYRFLIINPCNTASCTLLKDAWQLPCP